MLPPGCHQPCWLPLMAVHHQGSVLVFLGSLTYDCASVGCMAALDAEHYLQEHGVQEGKSEPFGVTAHAADHFAASNGNSIPNGATSTGPPAAPEPVHA